MKSNLLRFSLASWLLMGIHVAMLGATVADDSTTIADPVWRYTTEKPQGNWQATKFDDKAWDEGHGGFGTRETPGSRISTVWRTPDIWLRRTVHLESVPQQAGLYLFHDEDAEVYINGVKVATLSGYVTEYKVVRLDERARAALREGDNVIAVHCHQTTGGQAIDVHVVDANQVPKLPQAKRPTTPFKSELVTEWGAKLNPENVWSEYPRPQLVRDNWRNLNGHWDYAITPRDQASFPGTWDGKILVPFAIESKLSGVQRLLNPGETLWYHRVFAATPTQERRMLLNFEAVDYRCDVFVNDIRVGTHQGGNVPFSFDVTQAIRAGENRLVVRVDDDTEGFQLRGKQVLNPQGIWYTQVSGIWQTVWVEEVSTTFIEDLRITTNAAAGSITVAADSERLDGRKVLMRVVVRDGDEVVQTQEGAIDGVTLSIADAKLWSPDDPHLYALDISLIDDTGRVIDTVESYAGIRTVGKARDAEGHLRFTLNGKEIFHWGPLDQGWWPDGLLTPPSDEAMLFDVEYLQASGFNMIRKHIKVEPRRYYYHCDRLGMLVWQDQVSGGASPKWTFLEPNPEDAEWADEHHAQFMREFEAMVDTLENHPSIVVWVPFNEAWGQHRTMEVGQWILKRDPSRLVNIASGGNFWPIGDIADRHNYPHPSFPFDPTRYEDFVKVVGEFGGHGLPVSGHLWDKDANNWGYGGLPKDKTEFKERYQESIRRLVELRESGIAGGVYTQTTDVEGEINGLMTYDRKVIKLQPGELEKIHAPLMK